MSLAVIDASVLAAYVALAEHLRATLITCDVRLATAAGAKCTFDVIG